MSRGESHEERRARRERQDMEDLLARPAFHRFLFRVIQASRIFSGATDGSETRAINDGRRDLGLEILAMAEAGQPLPALHPDGPIFSILMALRAETNQPEVSRGETTNERKERYDRTAELNEPDDDAPADDDAR